MIIKAVYEDKQNKKVAFFHVLDEYYMEQRAMELLESEHVNKLYSYKEDYMNYNLAERCERGKAIKREIMLMRDDYIIIEKGWCV